MEKEAAVEGPGPEVSDPLNLPEEFQKVLVVSESAPLGKILKVFPKADNKICMSAAGAIGKRFACEAGPPFLFFFFGTAPADDKWDFPPKNQQFPRSKA